MDPSRFFETTADGVIPVKTAPIELSTGNNQQVIAAATGQRHRILGWTAQGTTSTQPYFYLKSASGGTLRTARWTAPASTSPPWERPFNEKGYFETNTGEGLFIDITTAALSMDVFYVTYTPA